MTATDSTYIQENNLREALIIGQPASSKDLINVGIRANALWTDNRQIYTDE